MHTLLLVTVLVVVGLGIFSAGYYVGWRTRDHQQP